MNFLIDLGLIAAISCFDIAAFLVNSKLGCKKIQTCFSTFEFDMLIIDAFPCLFPE